MQNFTTASLKGHRDIEEQILRLQNYINGSRYTVAITGAGISMAAGIITRARERLKIYWTPEVENKVLSNMAPMDRKKDVGILRKFGL